ncbi:unnamed protein product [Bursaphelenchus xylophilus]|uniref:(pine wood nematode) hypothetical protein n=1 Tax=Bursaphelenchus xylophilus TaxID=6326 RepID=A0A1I7S077_BURXY|nr:unnamed protein product [Bursaphelenchus xylophilus]CAG9108960.1 unnamed protein product [Bursaphelenchus xylophilus]
MEVDDFLHDASPGEDTDLPADPCQPVQPNHPHCSTMQSERIVGHVLKRGRLYYMYIPGYGIPPIVESPVNLPVHLIAQFEYEFAQKGPSMFPPTGVSYNTEVAEVVWTGLFDGISYALLRHIDNVHRLVPLGWAQLHFPELMRRYLQADSAYHNNNHFKHLNSTRHRWNPMNPTQSRRSITRPTPNVMTRPMFPQPSNTYNFNGPELRVPDLQVPSMSLHNQLQNLVPPTHSNNIMNSLPNPQPLNLQPPPSFLNMTNQNALNLLNNPEPLAILDSVATTLSQVITDVQKSASNIVVSEDPYQEKPESAGQEDEEVPPDPFNISSTLQPPHNQRMCSVNMTTVLRRQNRKLMHDEVMDSEAHGFAGPSSKRRRV